MDSLFRVRTIAYCVAFALAQAGVAGADSAVGINTTLGNAQQAVPVNPDAKQAGGLDPEGLGLRGVPSHSPSGILYEVPFADSDLGDNKGMSIHGSLEGGLVNVNGAENAQYYKTYKDYEGGAVLESFSLQGENPEEATYVEVTGGGVGHDDQFYGAQFGKYNDWKVKGFYTGIPHVFSTTIKNIWDGTGTGVLKLKNGIPANGGLTLDTASGNFVAPYFGYTTPTTAAVLGAAATNTTNGGINSLVTRALMSMQAGQGYSEMSLIRKQSGVGLESQLNDSWKFFVTASQEKRKGARPTGLTMSSFNDTAEIPEPIDYTTNDFKVGLRYKDKLTQFNIIAAANLFHDAYTEAIVDSPFVQNISAAGALVTSVPWSTPASNQAYSLTGEFARNLPDFYNGRFNATVSWNTARNNEALLPWSNTTGTQANPGGQGGFNGNWSQMNRSTGNTDARIDTKLVDLKFAFQPLDKLTVAGKLRWFETDNKTVYLACNPYAAYSDGTQYTGTFDGHSCTGVWGYVGASSAPSLLNNRGVTGGLIPTAGGLATNKWLRNVPWDRKEITPGVSLDYSLTPFSSLNASVERETIDRQNRERDQTWEDKIKIGYTNRALGAGTLRLSYENDRRRGTTYNPSPYVMKYSGLAFNDFTSYAGSLTSLYVANGELRKPDVGDRDQNILNARLNYALMEGLNLGSTLQLKNVKYPSVVVGRQDQSSDSASFDLNYSAIEGQVWTASYTYQDNELKQGNIQNGNFVVGTCNAGQVVNGVTVNYLNAVQVCDTVFGGQWNPLNLAGMDTRDTSQVWSLGLKMDMGKNLLDVNYSHTGSVSKTGYNYNPAGTTIAAANQALAGGGFPDATFSIDTLNGSLRIPLDKQLALRLVGSYESGKVTDWHYTGLEKNGSMITGVQNNPAFIDAGPRDYHVTTAGVMLQYKM